MKRLAILAIFILIVSSLHAETFIMDRYSVSVDIDSARVMHYEEVMDLDFIYPSHGIIRDIQYRFPGYGGYPETRADVSNIRGTELSGSEKGSSFVSLRLGSPDRLISGKHAFSISYDFDMGKDYYDGYDEVYINIVSSDGWDTLIREADFSVTMPFPVESDHIWVTYGSYGSTELLPFSLSDDGRTITGTAYDLRQGEALTLRAEMDEGYFADASDPYTEMWLAFLAGAALSVILVAAVFVLYFRYGRDERLAVPVEFGPPDGISPMDASYIVDGDIGDDAVGAMLLYWADRGYIRIDETERGRYAFSVIMWPVDMEPREAALFNSFFTESSVDGKTLRSSGFPGKIRSAVMPLMNEHFSGERSLFDPRSLRMKGYASILTAAIAAVNAVVSILMAGAGVAMPVAILSFMAFASSRTLASARKLSAPVVAFMAFFLFFIGFGFCSFMGTVVPSSIALAEASVFIASVFISSIATSFISKRSRYGNEMKRRLDGFREYIDKVEKDRIGKLSEDDPRYFYHILSYAMVFGLAEKWCSKFRGIAVEDAGWYRPYGGAGDIMAYAYFSHRWRTMYRTDIMPRGNGGRMGGGRPTFSGSSGHAGGGFSGGGGRSW